MRLKALLRQLCLAAALLAAPAAHAQAMRDVRIPDFALTPGQMVDVGGYRLNLYCMGRGTPTVILEAGGGWGAVAWAGVQPVLARRTRVCSYDRAGMNFSDFRPGDGGPSAEVDDLRKLVRAARLPGPFVMVGWSAGGMIGRRWAWSYPDEVAGLVTVDGSNFDFNANFGGDWRPRAIEALTRCAADARSGKFDSDPAALARCAPAVNPLFLVPEFGRLMAARVRDPRAYETPLRGLQSMDADVASLKAMQKSFGRMPLTVLLAGTHLGRNQAFVDSGIEIAKLSSRGIATVVPGASHMIHLERPDAVISAVNAMVDTVRADRRAQTGARGL